MKNLEARAKPCLLRRIGVAVTPKQVANGSSDYAPSLFEINAQAAPIKFSTIFELDNTPGNPAPGCVPAPTK